MFGQLDFEDPKKCKSVTKYRYGIGKERICCNLQTVVSMMLRCRKNSKRSHKLIARFIKYDKHECLEILLHVAKYAKFSCISSLHHGGTCSR